MTEIHEGGCQCGAVRYRFTGRPQTLYLCHCRDCQKQSASAFGMSLWVARENFEIVQGTPKVWIRGAASGGQVICSFCPECGSRLFHAGAPDSEVVSLKAGSLDDTSWLKPAGHLWTKSAQPWMRLDGAFAFEGEPPDDEILTACYAD
ncbi:MAG: GFA family protein [Pseudomonadota bacterium]